VLTKFFRVGTAVLLLGVVVAAAGCGETPESRRKAAQAAADQYFEYIKARDYEGAYRNTFSSRHRGELSLEDFVLYRRSLEAWTGPISGYRVVGYHPDPGNNRIRFTYALEPQDPAKARPSAGATTEILDLVEEEGEWRVAALNVHRTPPANTNAHPQPGAQRRPGAGG
jgi:hypothetical protein